jgi:hypothetical protein
MCTCPHCQATTHQNKAGKDEAGMQQYRCMHCKTVYTPEPRLQNVAVRAPVGLAIPGQKLQPVLASAGGDQLVGPVNRAFPTEKKRGFLSSLVDWGGTTNQWGRLPELAVLQTAGLLLLAWAFVQARAAGPAADALSWIGLAVLILPTAFRLASAQPARRERLGLILLLGMSLYLVKVMHSPMAFTFPDELSHLRNVNEILRTYHLFQENPVQPVTALYPGLPTVTSTLMMLSGMSAYSAGIIVIGAARLILFLSLFLLYEQVGGSARVAGLGVLLYMANANFLYWTAEYAYEPLALPLVVLVLLAVAKRETASDRRQHVAWTVVAVAGLLTVVITHHMSSYILTGLLIALVVFYRIHSRGTKWGPWDLALVALVASSSWLIFVANLTVNYLAPVIFGAIRSIFNLVAQEEQSRELFTSTTTGSVAPLWQQIVGIGSVILIALGLPFGAFEVLEKHRDKVIALLLAAIAMLFLPIQMLRFSKAGWETANRSSEFLFIGVGFVLALGILEFWFSKQTWTAWKGQGVLAALAITLFFGGLIAGWPPRARLPHAYVVSAGDHLVKPQVVTVSEWLLANLGRDNRIAASKADAKVIGAYNQYPFTSSSGGIQDMFFSAGVGQSERNSLSKRNIEYVMSDRKLISWDHMIGYYFYNQQYGSSSELKLVDQNVFEKFDGLESVNRMLDAGDIVVYDVGKYLTSNNSQSKTAKSMSRASSLHSSAPLNNTGQFASDSKEVAKQVHSRMPERMLICNAQALQDHESLSTKWNKFLNSALRAECQNGRMS